LINLCPDKYQQYAAALIVVAKNFETLIKYIAIQFHYFIIGVSILSVVAFVSQSEEIGSVEFQTLHLPLVELNTYLTPSLILWSS